MGVAWGPHQVWPLDRGAQGSCPGPLAMPVLPACGPRRASGAPCASSSPLLLQGWSWRPRLLGLRWAGGCSRQRLWGPGSKALGSQHTGPQLSAEQQHPDAWTWHMEGRGHPLAPL